MDNLRSNPALQLILAILAFAVPWGGMLIAILLIVALRHDPRYDTLSKVAWWLAWLSIILGILGVIFSIIGFTIGLALLPFRIVGGLLF